LAALIWWNGKFNQGMPLLVFDLATEADDAGLRHLLRENPMEGSISLSLEREPNYFNASSIEGPFHQTIVARETGRDEIIAVGNRSVRPMFVNGTMREIGYMSQLRVHPNYGKGLYLARGLTQGFKLYHDLHTDGRVPFYLMSVIEDNIPARRLLTSRLPEFPQAQEYCRMFTYAIYPRRHKPSRSLPRSLQLVRGGDQYANGIVECLNRNGTRKQFAPYWTLDSLFEFNLSPSDFFIVLDGDCAVGCLACWDQNAFKQTIVRGYSGAMARWRKFINLASRLGIAPYLPEPNTQLSYCYASHTAVDDDNPVVFSALLRALYNEVATRHYDYFIIGLAESNPFGRIVKSYHPLTYTSQIYLTGWDDCLQAIAQVDARPPAIEIAVL
jgi:hypothetical protein